MTFNKKASSLLALLIVLSFVLTSCMAKNKSDMQATPNYEGGNYRVEDNTNGERYNEIIENKEIDANVESVTTFSLKVDTAAYSNMVRYIEEGQLPPTDAVRVEEYMNYFKYDGKISLGVEPFGTSIEIGKSIFNPSKNLAFIRIKTEDIDLSELPKNNLTFLIDTSGSMYSHDKLPLLQEAFSLLIETLDKDDIVSIVTYAGSSDVVLDSVKVSERQKIRDAIFNLKAGGSTAGAKGIETAYELAAKNFIKEGNNRVILATDGDFNVGISSTEKLSKFISNKRDTGVYLSILGFGTGNIRDDIMETLSKDGNGNYAYINSLSEAEKVLVKEMGANLITVANDVKAQVEFNPEVVKNYRLIGYENRKLDNDDFENDKKDAGEIGAETDVIALFEFEYVDGYNARSDSPTIFTLNIRYKTPGESPSKLYSTTATRVNELQDNSSDFNFAAAVAGYGHILRDSKYSGEINYDFLIKLAKNNLGSDADNYRKDFIDILKKAKSIK